MNIDSLIQELGDLCHESYTGCNNLNAAIGEYEYCYKNEVINLLDTVEGKEIIQKYFEKLIADIPDGTKLVGQKWDMWTEEFKQQLRDKWL